MTQLALTQGAYQARGVIANAQVCRNLYPEPNPQDAPFPVTHYPAPGLRVLSDFTGTYSGPVRGLYQMSDGRVIAVIGGDVIHWQGNGNDNIYLGTIGNSGNPVSMIDNGTDLVLVDGTANGWSINLHTAGAVIAPITDPAWFGSTRVDYIDTFLVFNAPNTQTFYTSTAGAFLPLDATYATPKIGWNDFLVAVAVLHDNVWLLGNVTTEVWFNSGGATFPFARMPNAIIQQGCVARFSPVIADNAIYWIGQDRHGRNIALRGEGYTAKRISTFAIEDQWSLYGSLDDAIGMAYQIGGHEVVGWYFPSGNAWWAHDTSTGMWHQRTYNGTSAPWLPRCMCGWGSSGFAAVNSILAGDRTGPRIFEVSKTAYDDAGVAITRQRSWPHVQGDGRRIAHTRFAAAFGFGTFQGSDSHEVTLDWSDSAGNFYGSPLPMNIGIAPDAQAQWRRLGYARDRVYRLTWTTPIPAALNGAWVDVTSMGT